jgi:carboxyl-terminal processing protease
VVKAQPVTLAKAGEKEANGKSQKPKETTPSSSLRTGDEATPRSNSGPVETSGDTPLEEDVQLQKAVELLKTWKIFKELRPL